MELYNPDWSEDTIARVSIMLNKHMTVFEWGTGYSTIWLAQRCGQVITMEHNPEWYTKIKQIATEEGIENIDFNIFSLDDDRYYEHIHNIGDIDFIIIDGRNRMRCFEEAFKLQKPIMLDDSEREKYNIAYSYGLNFKDTLPTPQGQKATIFND